MDKELDPAQVVKNETLENETQDELKEMEGVLFPEPQIEDKPEKVATVNLMDGLADKPKKKRGRGRPKNPKTSEEAKQENKTENLKMTGACLMVDMSENFIDFCSGNVYNETEKKTLLQLYYDYLNEKDINISTGTMLLFVQGSIALNKMSNPKKGSKIANWFKKKKISKFNPFSKDKK